MGKMQMKRRETYEKSTSDPSGGVPGTFSGGMRRQRFFRACFHSAGYLWLRAGFRACGGRRLHRRFLLHVQRHIYFHGPHRVGRGVEYQDYDSNSQQNTQTEQVDTAITKGATCLIVNIVETGSDDAAQGIVDKAKAADIPVIFFNREVSDAVVNSYEKCAFIGTDAAEAGHMQGQMIADYLLANYDDVDLNGDGTISYVMFKGQNANPEAEYRTQYAVEDCDAALEAAGKPALTFYDANNADKFLVDRNGTWSAQASNEYMTTILSEYTEANNNMVELVICNNDGMAEGAITALKTAGYNASADKAIPVFGVDATDAAKELIAAGSMVGSIKQDAEGMAAAIALLAKNATSGAALMDGTDSYNVDDASAKIRIPYAVYTG